MSDDELDPGANTQMFQAFVDRGREPEPPSGTRWVWPVVGGVVLVVVALVLVWVLFG